MAWDESADRFILGTTTATGASTGDLTIAAAKLEVSGIVIGSADINEAELEILDGATLSTTELNYVDGVTSAIQTQLDSKLATAGGTMTGDLILGDNVKIELGNASGGDLQIYHDGSSSFIKDAGVGQLQLHTDDFEVKNAAGNEAMLRAFQNGAVQLNFDNSTKLATSASGVTISGTATADTFSGSGLGKLLKSETATSTSTFSTTTQVPTDGTPPTGNEGIQVMTRSFTPTAASSTLVHTLNFYTGGQDGRSFTITSIFRANNTRIASSACCQGDNGHLTPQLLQGTESAGGTSQIDYEVRFGVGFNTSTVYWLQASGTNGVPSGNIVDLITTWRIDEIGA
jgi:hypothetical protein